MKVIDLTLAICIYNTELYIVETLQSVMQQTMQDFYLLIVNDCSTDESVKIVKQFFTEHSRQYELVDLKKIKEFVMLAILPNDMLQQLT